MEGVYTVAIYLSVWGVLWDKVDRMNYILSQHPSRCCHLQTIIKAFPVFFLVKSLTKLETNILYNRGGSCQEEFRFHSLTEGRWYGTSMHSHLYVNLLFQGLLSSLSTSKNDRSWWKAGRFSGSWMRQRWWIKLISYKCIQKFGETVVLRDKEIFFKYFSSVAIIYSSFFTLMFFSNFCQ